MEKKVYQYWLYSMESIGKKTVEQLLENFEDEKAVYHASDKELSKALTQKQRSIMKENRVKDPHKMYRELLESGIRFVTRDDSEFPQKLRDIPDAPLALYVKGRMPDPDVPSVAIVGARFCSSYGRYMARQFGMELAQNGFQVISGMALGVDGISQTAALQAGGYSAGILGCGADVCYPPENRTLYDSLCTQGGIISEYVPGTVPKPGLFPPRNRIISGLADAVLVVEARAKSGTLITVDMALEQGRDVFVLPGRATDRLSDGCNLLLKQGAIPAMQASDIVEYYAGVQDEAASDRKKETGPKLNLSALERSLLEALDIHLQPVAEILDRPQLAGIGASAREMLCALTELSLKGLVEQEGNCFARRL